MKHTPTQSKLLDFLHREIQKKGKLAILLAKYWVENEGKDGHCCIFISPK